MNGADGGADHTALEHLMHTIRNYSTAEVIRTATAAEVARYIELVLALPSCQRHEGVVDGAEFGVDGDVYVSGYIAALDF